MAIQICSIHTCSYVPLKNVFQTFLLQVKHCQHQISFLSFTRDKCDKTSKAKLLGQAAALMSVFSPLPSCSSTGPERPPVGQLQPFDQVPGEALRRSWQLGLADMAEQMLRMGGAGATLDLRGTRHPIWTSSPGREAGKEWEQQGVESNFLGWSADLWEFAVF